MNRHGPRFPHKSLIVGILFILGGGLLLLWRLRLLPSLGTLWPLPFLVFGLGFLYIVFIRGGSKKLITPGMLLSLGSIFFLLQNTVVTTLSLSKSWPALMLITGLSFLPYGFSKSRNTRIAIVVPALAIIGLSIIFFPFSLGLVDESFTDFVLTWWPTLLVLSGIILIISYNMRRDR